MQIATKVRELPVKYNVPKSSNINADSENLNKGL